jgi:wobble nucleotide-excising tRNase
MTGKFGAEFRQSAADLKAEIAKKTAELGLGGDVNKIAKDSAAAAAAKTANDTKSAANTMASATSALTSALQSAADQIASAAKEWIGSIKERTQYERAVSVGSLTKNANRQIADIAELTSGLSNLRSRGVSQTVLDALGINNVADTRQLRKLVNSSDTDLLALVQAVSTLDKSATDLATAEEDRRTRTNITQAIIDAANTLGIGLNAGQAASISNQFNITPGMSAEETALQILSILTSGRISR